jgi:hypothetical protein
VTGSFGSDCPKCRQRAPIVLRGLESRCAACGASRFLLAAPNVGLAGQPSRIGGIAATILGIAVLVLGLSLSVGVWFLFQAFMSTTALSWAFAVPTAAASLFWGLLLLFGGKKLRRSGEDRQQQVQLDAVKAMVQHRRGPISALEAARALELPEPQVDALLQRLARERATAVTLDVDEQGHVVYDFDGEERRWRVLEEDVAAEEAGTEPAGTGAQRFRR